MIMILNVSKYSDLALRKTSTWMGIDSIGPFIPGDIVEFHIWAFNQGNEDAYNVQITDYLNDGYIFDVNNDNLGWINNNGLVQYIIPGPLLPGDSVLLKLNLEVQVAPGAQPDDWYNEAEVSYAEDIDMNEQEDSDSTPDTDPDNDNDLVDGDDEDNIFNGDNNDNVIDEHIHDPFNEGDDDEDDNDAAEILVTGEIGDTVFKDLDGDGIQDPNEPGVEGIEVVLTRCDGMDMDPWVTDTIYTDENGFYLFDQLLPSLINGEYKVTFNIGSLRGSTRYSCAWLLLDFPRSR